MLYQYILYHGETLRYIQYAFYELEKTQIAFEQYWLIDSKIR